MNELDRARNLLDTADKIIVLTGAGFGVSLGTPVYWTGENNRYGGEESRFGFTDLEHAHADMWFNRKAEQIEFFHEKWRDMVNQVIVGEDSPYTLLLDYLNNANKDYFVVTSNVDHAFVRSGFEPFKVLEVHGAYNRSQCLTERLAHGVFLTKNPNEGVTVCPKCGSDTRPNVLLFDDPYFNRGFNLIQEMRFYDFLEPIREGETRTVILEIGAGLTVPNIRNQTSRLSFELNIPVIRINLHQTQAGDHTNNFNIPVLEFPMETVEGLKTILSPK